jgi:uncharacterized protein
MALVFADSAYFVALLNPRDQLHDIALSAARIIESDPQTGLLTTENVLVEVLTFLSTFGSASRERAANLVDTLRREPQTTVLAQTPQLFDSGLRLYRARLDKSYSMTDCISMTVCRSQRIQQVLTHDHDFEQEGFRILL